MFSRGREPIGWPIYLSIIYLSHLFFMERERKRKFFFFFFFLEEFTHVITGTGKSEICIAGQQAARLGKVDILSGV